MLVSTSFLKEGSYSNYIKELNKSNTDFIHYDVMDGKFVKNTNLKPLKELEKYINLSNKKIDIHLMVDNPKKYIDGLSLYNIYNITVHKEIKDYEKMIELIKSYGIRAGLAINPDTDIKDIYNILPKLDLVLIMGVFPGESGQTFIDSVEDKIHLLRDEINSRELNTLISVDGGICEEVFDKVKDADIVVSASYILDDLSNIEKIKNM